MALLNKIAWNFFRAADATIVRSGLRKSRVGNQGIAGLNQLGARLMRALLAAHPGPFEIHGHRMHLSNHRSPSVAFTVSMLLDRYEVGTTRLFERLLKPGMTVLDVGAHVGYFSLLASGLVGSEGRVFALEPDPSNSELLQMNIELNSCSNISPLRIAAAERSGRMTLVLDAKGNDRHALIADKKSLSPKQNTVEVATISVDDFLTEKGWPSIDLLKIDAEGAEYTILNGMRRSLRARKVQRLIFEFTPSASSVSNVSPGAFLDQLTGWGFDVHQIEVTGQVRRIEGQDFALLIGQIEAKGACNLMAELRKEE